MKKALYPSLLLMLVAIGLISGDRAPLSEFDARAAQVAFYPMEGPQADPLGKTGQTSQVPEHPLVPALHLAREAIARIDQEIKDYSCTLYKRENIGGEVGEVQKIFMKLRHEPFSVYLYFHEPAGVKGRECLYVQGANENKLIAHDGGGFLKSFFPTAHIDPDGFIAMRNQRYPITAIGMRNLTERLIEVGEHDLQFGECEVQFFQDALVEGRKCTRIEVKHPHKRKEFRYYLAEIFIDETLRLPIVFRSFDWPSRPGADPPLLEEYIYTDIKLNNGFTDADFNPKNKQYNF